MPKRGPGADHPTLISVEDARSGLPRAVAPMRPRTAAAPFNSPDHLFEVKWDGIRAIAGRDDAGLRLVDRHGGDLLAAIPELRGLRLPEGALLDGEVIICDQRGRPNYELLAGRLGPKSVRRGRGPLFVAFDLLYEGYRPLVARPLGERRRRLLALGLPAGRLVVPEHLDEDGEPFLEVVGEYGLEGIVAKRRESPYVAGARTADWLRLYVTERLDVVLGGLLEDERRGVHAALCGVQGEDGRLAYAGEAYVPPYLGTWLDAATRDFASSDSPFAAPLSLRPGLRWLRPRLVAIVEHEGIEQGQVRDARFRALRMDGSPADCVLDTPVAVPSRPPSGPRERPRLVVLHSLPFPID
ncbi:MAG: hypothetical protein ACRDGE_10715 [Candidatus Limnocylindria bacterium]